MMEYSRISEDVTSLMSENEITNQFEGPLSSEDFPKREARAKPISEDRNQSKLMRSASH